MQAGTGQLYTEALLIWGVSTLVLCVLLAGRLVPSLRCCVLCWRLKDTHSSCCGQRDLEWNQQFQ